MFGRQLTIEITELQRAGWSKWRLASIVLCNRRISTRLREKFYRTRIRPAMTYGAYGGQLEYNIQHMHTMCSKDENVEIDVC